MYGETAASIRSRFGQAHAQLFQIQNDIRLGVEYDRSGAISGARIASSGYFSDSAEVYRLIGTRVVDSVLEMLAPGIVSVGRGSAIIQQLARNTFTELTYKGCRLSRQFLWSEGEDRSIVATLAGAPGCFNNMNGNAARTFEARYGLPEWEQFSTDGNVDVRATYKISGPVTRIDLVPTGSVFIPRRSVAVLNTATIEILINHFAPLESIINGKERVVFNGSEEEDILANPHIAIIRNYKDHILRHASITWM